MSSTVPEVRKKSVDAHPQLLNQTGLWGEHDPSPPDTSQPIISSVWG
jgi:hypothetical protein